MTYPPIAQLVPHTPPMRLLDEVVDKNELAISCKLVLRPDSTFVRQGRVRTVVSLEYMAQAVAAFAGFEHYHAGRPPRLGYLVSVRDAVFETDYLYVGDSLVVRAENRWGSHQNAIFQCDVHCSGRPVARATLTVVEADGEREP